MGRPHSRCLGLRLTRARQHSMHHRSQSSACSRARAHGTPLRGPARARGSRRPGWAPRAAGARAAPPRRRRRLPLPECAVAAQAGEQAAVAAKAAGWAGSAWVGWAAARGAVLAAHSNRPRGQRTAPLRPHPRSGAHAWIRAWRDARERRELRGSQAAAANATATAPPANWGSRAPRASPHCDGSRGNDPLAMRGAQRPA